MKERNKYLNYKVIYCRLEIEMANNSTEWLPIVTSTSQTHLIYHFIDEK